MAKNIVIRKTVTTVIGYQEPVSYVTAYKMCDDKIELDFSVVDGGADRRFEVTLTAAAARRLAAELAERVAATVA